MPKTGTLRKKGNFYYYRFYHEGKQIEISTGQSSKREAIRRANEIYAETALKPNDPSYSIQTLLSRHLEGEKQRLELSSYKEKERILTTHFMTHFGPKKDIREIKVWDIEAYIHEKLKTLSSNTVNKHFHLINNFFKFLQKNEIITTNPAELADRPKKTKSKVAQTLTAEQARHYVDALKNEDSSFEIAVHLALFGGLRREEVVGLRFPHVDIIDGQAHCDIQTVITVADGEIIYKKPKANAYGIVPLPVETTTLIQAQHTRMLEAKLRYGPALVQDYIVGTDIFTHVQPDWITRTNRKMLEKYNLPPVRFHDLRHTHASLLYQNGVDIKDISDRLRHSTLSITADIYVHNENNKQAQLAKKMGEII